MILLLRSHRTQTRISMIETTKNETDVGKQSRQRWIVTLKSAPHKANFENDIPHHRDCQWSTIGRDWNWIKRKLFLLLWSPSFLLPLSNCCNKDTVGCSVQWRCLLSKPKFNSKFLWQFLEGWEVQGVQEKNLTWIFAPKVKIDRSLLVLNIIALCGLVILRRSNKSFKPKYFFGYELKAP